MEELHPINEGRTGKLKREFEADPGRMAVVSGIAGMIMTRDKMIRDGGPQEQIDHVTKQIDESMDRKSEEEKRLIELAIGEQTDFKVRIDELNQQTQPEGEL